MLVLHAELVGEVCAHLALVERCRRDGRRGLAGEGDGDAVSRACEGGREQGNKEEEEEEGGAARHARDDGSSAAHHVTVDFFLKPDTFIRTCVRSEVSCLPILGSHLTERPHVR